MNVDNLLKGVSPEWRKLLDTPYLEPIIYRLNNEYSITPGVDNIFEAFRTTPYTQCDAVIIGCEPYSDGSSHGYAFSLLKNISPELYEIYKALIYTQELDTIPSTGNIVNWSRQGMLMLNSALTTRVNDPKSHIDLWYAYISNFIRQFTLQKISENTHITFMLWGIDIQKMVIDAIGDIIDKQTADLSTPDLITLMKYYQPKINTYDSKLSFTKCDHFKRYNAIRLSYGKQLIDWHSNAPIHDSPIVICTDGSVTNNGKPNAVGGYAGIVHEFINGKVTRQTVINGRTPTCRVIGRNAYDTKYIPPTNNRSEYYAVLFSLWATESLPGAVTIATDSEILFKTITIWLAKWIADDTLNKKENVDIIVAIQQAIVGRKYPVTFRFVKAHPNSIQRIPITANLYARTVQHGNELADQYAKSGQYYTDYETHINIASTLL